MAIRHARVLDLPDQTEPYLVNGVEVDPATVAQPSDWDAAHVGGVSLIDLGVVSIVDRLTSSATLYTPASGELVLGLRVSDLVATDTGLIIIGQGASGPGQRGQLGDIWYPINGAGVTVPDDPNVSGAPIVAHALLTDVEAWQANFDYPDEVTSVIGAGHLWSLSGVGTSGATEPDWASYIDGSAPDGGTSWVDQGPLPTVGSVHLYALVGTAVAP